MAEGGDKGVTSTHLTIAVAPTTRPVVGRKAT